MNVPQQHWFRLVANEKWAAKELRRNLIKQTNHHKELCLRRSCGGGPPFHLCGNQLRGNFRQDYRLAIATAQRGINMP
jgi:hypothetical protein